MATIHQIRGAILEAAVAKLLTLVGYRIADDSEPDTQIGSSGLEVSGRGCCHQIDCLACLEAAPAFTYPLRLIVEAKCYLTKKIGIDVIRNAVGVQKDISEIFFLATPRLRMSIKCKDTITIMLFFLPVGIRKLHSNMPLRTKFI